jgi:hypothetical protein
LKTKNGNIRSTGKQCTAKAKEGYCNEATQSGPPRASPKCSRICRGKTKKGLDKRGNKRSDMVLHVLQTRHLTENYKTVYEIWRQRSPTCRMYMDTKKLMKQKNYINKHKKITEAIKRELQASQESQLAGREEEKLVHAVTVKKTNTS